MNLQKIYNQVAEFHQAFLIPQGNVNKQLRHDMLLSEVNEFEDEIKDGVITVNAYKELCDIIYVAIGTAYLHGLENIIKGFDKNIIIDSVEDAKKYYNDNIKCIESFIYYTKIQNDYYLNESSALSFETEVYMTEVRVHHLISEVIRIIMLLGLDKNGCRHKVNVLRWFCKSILLRK